MSQSLLNQNFSRSRCIYLVIKSSFTYRAQWNEKQKQKRFRPEGSSFLVCSFVRLFLFFFISPRYVREDFIARKEN